MSHTGALTGLPLGVGMPLLKEVPRELYARKDLVQFVELTPEMVCRERTVEGEHILELEPSELLALKAWGEGLPMVVHGTELSIGSAHGFNASYTPMLEELRRHWPFAWHSEHLGFQTYLDPVGTPRDAGVPLPLPPSAEAVRLVAARADALARRFHVPFLLENAAQYLVGLYPNAASEGHFVRAICERANCWLLLDLHNLYCNAKNAGFDPYDMLDAMPLERVIEVHVAGGSEQDGFWTDSHDGAVPEPVWRLLDHVAPRLVAWRGLVFEVLSSVVGRLPLSLLTEELARANATWQRFHPQLLLARHVAS